MEKKDIRKRASKWEQIGERALLEIWAEKMPQLRGCRKNSHIVQEMVADLRRQGFNYSADELKTKMHNITSRYRKEKQIIGTTGGSPSEWDLYKDMENLLTPFKSYNTQGLVFDSIDNIHSNIQSAPLPSPSSPSPPTPETSPPLLSALDSPPCSTSNPLRTPVNKKKQNFDKIIRCFEVSMEKMQSTAEKIASIEEEKKEILKKFAAKEAEVQNALIEFLKK